MDTLSRLSHDSDSEVAMVLEYLRGILFAIICLSQYLFYFIIYHLLWTNLLLQAAIISLGLIGAGTNNARIAGMLRNLSSYYYKDSSALFCVWSLIIYTFSCNFFNGQHADPLFTIFTGSDCPRTCAFGEGFIDPQSLSFWPFLAVTVSSNIPFILWNYLSATSVICWLMHSHNFFPCRMALAGLVTMLHACLDMKAIILGKYHYVLYFLVLAMQVI